MKQKDINSNIIFFIAIIGILVAVAIVFIGQNEARIESLQDEIASMPHYECWNETIEETLEIEPTNRDFLVINPYGYNPTLEDLYGEILCQEGINMHNRLGMLTNYNNETALCFTKRTREVCKLNRDVFQEKAE